MQNNYQEIITKIVNLFQLSTRDVSIHFHISIQNEKVTMDSFLIQLNGEKTNFQKINDYWNEDFYHNFLIPFLNLIYQKCSIVKTDIVPSLRGRPLPQRGQVLLALGPPDRLPQP